MEIYSLPKSTLPWWNRWWELFLLPLDSQKFSHSWPRGSLRSGAHGTQPLQVQEDALHIKATANLKMYRSPFISHSRTTGTLPRPMAPLCTGLFRNLWKAAFVGLALRRPILDKLHHPRSPASWKPVHGRAHFWGWGISGLAQQSWIGDCLEWNRQTWLEWTVCYPA